MRLVFTYIFFLFTFSLFSQDIHLSQVSETSLLLNPASAGVFNGFYRADLHYKSQWHSMQSPYRTMMASYDMPLTVWKKRRSHIGLGGFFYSDKAGDSKIGTTSGNVCVSAIVPIKEMHTLSAGFQFGVTQRSASITDLQWPNQYDGYSYNSGIPSNEANGFKPFAYFDMASGVHYQFLKINDKDIFRITAGAAYFHLTQPSLRYYPGVADNLFGKMVVNAQLRYDIPKTRIGILAMAVYSTQGPSSEMDFGGMLRYKLSQGTKITGFYTESAITGGLLVRTGDAIIPQIFFELANFGIGLSYDINVSGLTVATHEYGGLELSLKYSNMRDAVFKDRK